MGIFMKKLLSLLLSLIMLLSVVSGLQLSAFAEETANLVISSNVENATQDMVFQYRIKIDGELYNGVAIDEAGKEYTVSNGVASIPAMIKAKIAVTKGASFEVCRLEFNESGYETLAQTEPVVGVVDDYDYIKTVDEVETEITVEEYNTATNNGTLMPPIVTYYVNEDLGETLTRSEVTPGQYYQITLSGEEGVELAYKNGTATTHLSTVTVSSKFNVRKATTSFGKDSYYYDGKISFKIGESVFDDTYTTVLSTDKARAKENAETTIKPILRTLAYNALTELTKDKGTSAYFVDSIEAMSPTASAFSENTTEETIVDSNTTAYEFVPYVKQLVLYEKRSNGGDKNVCIDGKLVKAHVHSYSETVVAPDCETKGYTLHRCLCGDEYKDNYTNPTGHSYESRVTVKATTSKNGTLVKTCKKCNKRLSSSIPSVKSATLSATSYVYNGSAKKPTVTVKDSKGNKLVNNTDYTVTYSSGRKNVGKYTVTITLKGKYSGKLTKNFVINPKSTSISKLTPTSKGFKVTWKKQATQTTGYQIQYSTSSKFTNAKTVTVTKNSTTSKTISKLTAKKKYYVRVRTYKTVSGTKYYSAWSSSKNATTKK